MGNFEGETCLAVQVNFQVTQTSTVDSDLDGAGSEIICADMYVWNMARDVVEVSEKQ